MARQAWDPGIDGPRDTVSATPPPTPGFLAIPIDSGAPFRRLVNQLGPERLTLFLKLNRVDLAHVRAGDTLLLPADSTHWSTRAGPLPHPFAGAGFGPQAPGRVPAGPGLRGLRLWTLGD